MREKSLLIMICSEGQGRMTLFAAQSDARTFDYQAGDIGYVPASYGHYIENTGNTTLKFLEIFKTGEHCRLTVARSSF